MRYPGDDPRSLLQSARVPRTLTGDSRDNVAAGQPVQLIDIEYDRPKTLLISGKVLPLAMIAAFPTIQSNVGGAAADWKLSTGLDRSTLIVDKAFYSGNFTLTVIARSVQLIATPRDATSVGLPGPYTVQALVAEMDVSADIGNIQPLSTGAGNDRSRIGQIVAALQAGWVGYAGRGDLDTDLLNNNGVDGSRFGSGIRRGFSVMNPTSTNLYLTLGGLGAITAAGAYTINVQAGGYYESPFGYNGGVGFWFGATGAGNAFFNVFAAA